MADAAGNRGSCGNIHRARVWVHCPRDPDIHGWAVLGHDAGVPDRRPAHFARMSDFDRQGATCAAPAGARAQGQSNGEEVFRSGAVHCDLAQARNEGLKLGGDTMAAQVPQDFRRVIIAAAVGNVIEWYDFYIFGSLAAILAVKFFQQGHPVAALLSTIALFTAGFLIRPLGAFLFGWMGDRIGRKYTFLVTLSGMGLGTGAIGLMPTFDHIGLAAAFILFGLRMIQGLCLGGEYGGAITYVAEHVSDERRGYYTGWLQTSPTLGIVVSLAVIIACRTYFGNDAFNAWAWRVPFLVSFLLVAIAIYIRLQLQETPIFQEIKAKGMMTRNPWKEAFLSANIKL